jgi:mRNA capping enzyme
MRRVLNWFVDPSGNLSQSIFNMLECFTGEDLSKGGLEVSRTGSPIHRFKNSRTSDGRYTATSPNLLTYVMETTDSSAFYLILIFISFIQKRDLDIFVHRCIICSSMFIRTI